MAGPLLETKLQGPRRRRDSVARPRLTERLSRGAESQLTLISAPPGFGKTTLLADWLADTTSSGGRRRGFRSTGGTTIPHCSGHTLSPP
jgi:LuxR family transcriptional regulator, maltose regulon positive regulatory protein